MAQNVGSFYGEAAYSQLNIKDVSEYNLGTYKPTALRLTLGNVITNNLAIEGFVLQGLSGDTQQPYDDLSINVKLKTSYGVAIRPFVNLNDSVELYGRLGTVKAKNKASVTEAGVSETVSDSNTHTLYGAGLAYKVADKMKVIFDYTKLSTKNDTKSSLISVGLRYSF